VGQSTVALDHLNTALAIFEQYGRHLEIAIICVNTGDAYLREGEHMLAQAILRRSLSIAERIGDASIMSVVFGNLGILATRFGDLPEAEACFKQALAFAEQVNDPVYMSLWQGYQAPILQDQGKMNEATFSLRQALRISRTMNFTPCIGIALVVLGQLRIAQALAVRENDTGLTGTTKRSTTSSSTLLLRKARISLQRALSLEGLEAETRTEGRLALAKVALLLGEIGEARQQGLNVMNEAQRYEQIWLLACIQRLMDG
jgi:tetratricopeptide (TPR) repeat protein